MLHRKEKSQTFLRVKECMLAQLWVFHMANGNVGTGIQTARQMWITWGKNTAFVTTLLTLPHTFAISSQVFYNALTHLKQNHKTELWICNTGRRGYICLLSDSWSPGSVHPDVHKVMNFMKDFTTTYTCPVLILMRTKQIYRSTASFSFSQT